MRTARKESSSGYYHVMIRGTNKIPIFASLEEKEKIIQFIKEAKEKIEVAILAYCIMNNHMHLLIKAEKENLVQIMKKINIRYAMYYNKRQKRIGSVFQDRFKSQNIENESYLLSALRYIHNNPVKAEIVKEVTDYKYSSIHEYCLNTKGIIDLNEKLCIENFFKNKEEFLNYHKKQDILLHLDIKEDMNESQFKKAQIIINKVMKKEGIIKKEDIKNYKVKKEVIKQLILNTKLTAREISELTNITRSTVSRYKTEIKKQLMEK